MAIASDGTLYLGDRLGGTDNIAAYVPPYTGAAVAAFHPAGAPAGLVQLLVAPNGDLWVTDDYNAGTWKYAAPISGNPSPTVTLTGIGGPVMALDPSRNLFVGDTQSYLVDEYALPVSSGASPSLQVKQLAQRSVGLRHRRGRRSVFQHVAGPGVLLQLELVPTSGGGDFGFGEHPDRC